MVNKQQITAMFIDEQPVPVQRAIIGAGNTPSPFAANNLLEYLEQPVPKYRPVKNGKFQEEQPMPAELIKKIRKYHSRLIRQGISAEKADERTLKAFKLIETGK